MSGWRSRLRPARRRCTPSLGGRSRSGSRAALGRRSSTRRYAAPSWTSGSGAGSTANCLINSCRRQYCTRLEDEGVVEAEF